MSASMQTNDAVILCGGLGTRLRSQLPDTPKILAPIAGRPFLDILLDYLQGQGIGRVILCTGYLSGKVEAFCEQSDTDLEIQISAEKKPLGTGGALRRVRDRITNSSFFIFNGDSFCDINLSDVLAAHQRFENKATVVLSQVDDATDYGSVVIDDANQICSFQEKNPEARGPQLVNAGICCLSQDIFSMMPDDDKFSLERDVFTHMNKTDIGGFVTDRPFYDFGTPERFAVAENFF